MIRHSFILSVALLVLFSTFVSAMAEPDYYPLNVGNKWVYEYATIEGNTKCPETTISTVETLEIRDGEKYFGVKHESMGSEETSSSFAWLKKDIEGNTIYTSMGITPEMILIDWDPPLKLFPSSIEPGTAWTQTIKQYNSEYPDSVFYDRTEYRVISNDQTVTVPAGTFNNCVGIRAIHIDSNQDTTDVHELLFAPDVGNVFRRKTSDDGVDESTLTEYSIHIDN